MEFFRNSCLLADCMDTSLVTRAVMTLLSASGRELQVGIKFMKDFNLSLFNIGSHNYERARSELSSLNRIYENDMSPQEQARARDLSRILYDYAQAYSVLNDSYLNILALAFSAKNLSRAQILQQLEGKDWLHKQEILTLWAWIRAERDLISGGSVLEYPFCGHVEPRNRNKQARLVGREFYSLRLFLRQMKYVTGQELFFHHKQETPDFVLEDSSGQLVGAEMSEVPHSSEQAAEMDAETLVLERLQDILENLPVQIRIAEPSHRAAPRFWRTIASQIEKFTDWITSELIRSSGRHITLYHDSFGLQLEVQPKNNNSAIWTYSLAGETEQDDRTSEEEIAQSIYTRLRSKLFKRDSSGQERPRHPPCIRPCHLVLYPNTSPFGLNYESLASRAHEILDFDPLTYFDYIWLSSEKSVTRLL